MLFLLKSQFFRFAIVKVTLPGQMVETVEVQPPLFFYNLN